MSPTPSLVAVLFQEELCGTWLWAITVMTYAKLRDARRNKLINIFYLAASGQCGAL